MTIVRHREDPSLVWSFGELTIRPCEPEDLPGIAELAAAAFADYRSAPAEQWAAEWDWKFAGAHLGDRCASVAVDPQGRVVGHYGSLLRRFQLGKQVSLAGVPVDNVVREDYRGGRLQLRLYQHQQDWAAMEEVPWGIGAPTAAAYKIGKRLLGYRDLASMKILRADLSSRSRRLRTRLRRRRVGWVHPRRARVRELPAFDERFEELWEREREHYQCVEERTLAWLRWRFDDAPGRRYTILVLEQDDRLLRYALIKHPDPGDGTWQIVDLFGSCDPDDLLGMALGMVHWADGSAPWLEISLAATEAHYAALLQAGFYWEGREQPLVYWIFDERKVRRRLLEEPANWYVTEAFHDTK